MKKVSVVFVMALFIFSACGPKSYYETKIGKKKQRYYNDIQYGNKEHPRKGF